MVLAPFIMIGMIIFVLFYRVCFPFQTDLNLLIININLLCSDWKLFLFFIFTVETKTHNTQKTNIPSKSEWSLLNHCLQMKMWNQETTFNFPILANLVKPLYFHISSLYQCIMLYKRDYLDCSYQCFWFRHI